MSLKPYPQYKDSAIPWVGEIPYKWVMQKLRSLLSPISIRDGVDLPLLSVVRDKGVIIRNVKDLDENHNYIPEDLSNYKIVNKGQFVMNKMKAWQGSYGVSKFDGIVSPAYFVFNLNGVDADFFHTAIRSKAYIPFFTQSSDGIRIGQWDLNQSRMKEIPFWIPSIFEQYQITTYLNWKTLQINRFIKAKKKQIALLKEQKQVIINDAVTGKLDVRTGKPYQKYKVSGVGWLGRIPDGWQVCRLKDIASIYGRIGFRGYNQTDIVDEGSGAISLSPGNIKDNKLSLDKLTYVSWEKYYESPEIMIFNNDIILVKTGSSYGKSALIEEATVPMTINPQLIVFKEIKIHPRYLHKYLSSAAFTDQINRLIIGGATPTVGQNVLSQIVILVPDSNSIEEVSNYLESITKKIEDTILQLSTEISLMLEYHTRIIADVVTGQVDVGDKKVPEFDNDIEIEGIEDTTELEEDMEKVIVGNE